MPKRRLGVVLLIPPPWSHEIDGLRRAFGDGSLGRIPAHLTLVPPVNVREDAVADAMAVLRDAASSTRPFVVDLGPPATFLPVNPVAYLAVDGDGADEVERLRDAVFTGPFERDLTWPFVPHVTLADEADPDRIRAALGALRDYEIRVTFDRVHVLEQGDGRMWHPIADAPFASGPAVIGRGGLELELHSSSRLDAEAAQWMDAAWAAYAVGEYGTSENDEPFAIAARRNGVVVGTASGTTRSDGAYLADLIVDAADRGTGVGSHLLAAAESLAAERGCARITLRTPAGGAARTFYETRGWTVYAELPKWRNGRDFVQMERLLS